MIEILTSFLPITIVILTGLCTFALIKLVNNINK